MRKRVDPRLLKQLQQAELDFEHGRISRRQFNKLLTLVGVSAGLTLAQLQPAHAWVATRMRKRGNAAGSSFSVTASARFRSSDSCYFTRTPGSAGNRRTFTYSAWVKRGKLGAEQSLLEARAAGSSALFFDSSDCLRFSVDTGYTGIVTSSVFRDPTAWYHIVAVSDTTLALATDRHKIYVNGVLQPTSANSPCPQNHQGYLNAASVSHRIGASWDNTDFFDGSLTELVMVDGQALAPTSFGEWSATTGNWQPKQYSGTFGTNGFYLPFTSASAVNGSGTATGIYVGSPGTELEFAL